MRQTRTDGPIFAQEVSLSALPMFEYKLIQPPELEADYLRFLNLLGQQRWELVAILPRGLIFKRAVIEGLE